MPMIDRLKHFLRTGARTVKDAAEELGVPQDSIRKTVARHTSQFVRMGVRVALKAEGQDSSQQPTLTEEF